MKLNEVLTKIYPYKCQNENKGFESVGIYDKEGNPIIAFVERESTSDTYLSLIKEDPEVALVTTPIYDGTGKDIYGKPYNYHYVRLIIYLEK